MNAAEIRTEVDRLREARRSMLETAMNHLREMRRQQAMMNASLEKAELCRAQIEFLEGRLALRVA
jgi:hypothetical protein